GAIRFKKEGNNVTEELSTDDNMYSTVVNAIGEINAGSFNINNLGNFNETYIQIPTSYGKTKVFFKEIEDSNYSYNKNIIGGTKYIKGRDDKSTWNTTGYYDYAQEYFKGNYKPQYSINGEDWIDGWWYDINKYKEILSDSNYTYITDPKEENIPDNYLLRYVDNNNELIGEQFYRSNYDCLSINFDVEKDKFPDSPYNVMDFNDLATNPNNVLSNKYEFNAVLIYYKVYNQSGDVVLATNLLGVLFIDAPKGEFLISDEGIISSGIYFPTFEKLKSTSSGFGTSMSIRLSILSNNMIDDTDAIIVDKTDTVNNLNDFSEVFNSLNNALNILNENTKIISTVSDKHNNITGEITDIKNLINNFNFELSELKSDIKHNKDYLSIKGGNLEGKLSICNRGTSLNTIGNINLESINVDLYNDIINNLDASNINLGITLDANKVCLETGNISKNNNPFITSLHDNLTFGEKLNVFGVGNKTTIFIGNNITDTNNNSIEIKNNDNVILLGNNLKLNTDIIGNESLSNSILLGNNITLESNKDKLYIGNNFPIIEGDLSKDNNNISFNTENVFIKPLITKEHNAGSGTGLIITDEGKIMLAASSKRFKNTIKDLDESSHVFNLNPVTYEFNSQPGIENIGLIAEDVEKVDKRLVNYDNEGKPLSVKYDILSVLLLNEIKSLKNKVDILEQSINK
ncbi:MAG: tail fiber domain-containing protein, partial [Clostridia bacterium]